MNTTTQITVADLDRLKDLAEAFASAARQYGQAMTWHGLDEAAVRAARDVERAAQDAFYAAWARLRRDAPDGR